MSKINKEEPIGADCQCELGSSKHYYPDCEYLKEQNSPQPKPNWESKLGQMVSLAWKNGIWHSEATLFKDLKQFISSTVSEAIKKDRAEICEKIESKLLFGYNTPQEELIVMREKNKEAFDNLFVPFIVQRTAEIVKIKNDLLDLIKEK